MERERGGRSNRDEVTDRRWVFWSNRSSNYNLRSRNTTTDGDCSEVHVKEEDDEKVTLRVQQENMADFYFTMMRNEPLRKLMIAYCERRQLGDYRSLRFHVNGDRVHGDKTPNELELENDDVIDAWSEQFGGHIVF